MARSADNKNPKTRADFSIQGDESVRPESRFDETYVAFTNPTDQLERGIECCRKGDWKAGLEHLKAVAEQQTERGKLPSRYYSYAGYGMARNEKKYDQAIKLCKYAIKLEFYQPENYANLTRTYLLAGRRDAAHQVLSKGRKVDPRHPDLQELVKTMGYRRSPVLPFLSRGNAVNQLLGRFRHSFTVRKTKQAEAAKAKAEAEKAAAKRAAARNPAARARPPGK